MSEENRISKRIPLPQTLDVAKALSGELRMRILQALSEKPMTVSELSKLLDVAQPTATINIQMLEETGLVHTTHVHGRGKICSRACDSVILELPRKRNETELIKEIQMPVGLYTDFRVKPSCGMVGKDGVIGDVDNPQTFYLPDRADSSLVWFSEDGYLEYRFPNIVSRQTEAHTLSISAELCSEAWGYNETWPSDITLSINGVEVGTWTSPGDFGEVKGQLTPTWWHGVTQYGMLVEWSVGHDLSRINGEACSVTTLGELNLTPAEPIVVRFEVKPDALNRGGMNLFGKHFGNFHQDIKLTLSR
jgi:predicted transcriptional regulator